ncbi:type I polyketide synthase [Kribbella sp. NPDC056861]|uniref:type I polyketide synthase n=1 Tax=Kribbella sp. NPDC056861 TaxID=3154857 RepID=UPI003427A787
MVTERMPIAVVGMSCRCAPDLSSPDQLWDFLLAGSDAVGPIPAGRWSEYRDQGDQTRRVLRGVPADGCYLSDIAGFEAGFFGLSAQEARLMDPQHRLCLELGWEALEHAGIPPSTLTGTDTGVYVGIGSDDYGRRLLEDLPRIEPWTGIGASLCGAANRISHALDLRGPSVAIDTACSSSLVAIHQAMQALWLDEIPLAIAGGVMLMAGPALSVVLAEAGATAPDGRSKPFDASANGYGRGEGGGFVVLKRLDAVGDDDRVLAVLRGGAVRQDGRTDGIMTPHGPAQAHLLRVAYRNAGVDPATVGYVEAHGTGTIAGDPEEAAALTEVFDSCAIGSLKGNIGHLEAASGVLGLIKVIQGLRHGIIPPTLLRTGPTAAVDWQKTGLRLATEAQRWPGEPRRGGVASYGYGGTIAHLVVEQAPAAIAQPRTGRSRGPRILPLSSATESGVRASADALTDVVAELDLDDVAHTLSVRRQHLPVRYAIVAKSNQEMVSGLRAVESRRSHGNPVWVFSGHGQQWIGMGRQLLTDEPAFSAAVDGLEQVFEAELGRTARDLLAAGDFEYVTEAQAAIYVVQIGLAAVWRSWGIEPAAVIGHSVGEIAAAVTAGVLSAEDGARLVCRRSLLLAEVAGKGAMVMVPLPFATAGEMTAGDPEICAAISSSPHTTVLSGTPEAVERIRHRLVERGVDSRMVDTDVAFHSSQMDQLVERLADGVADLTISQPNVPLYTTALSDSRDDAVRDGGYWAANLRNPVHLAAAVLAAVEDGHDCFLELSAHPVVAQSIEESAPGTVVVTSLRRAEPERRALLTALADLYRGGVDPDWPAVQRGGGLVDLPTTQWQRIPLWAVSTPPSERLRPHDPTSRTLLGGSALSIGADRPLTCWQSRLSHATRPYPGDHPVAGSEIVPAAVLLHTFLTATGGDALADVELRVPLTTAPERDVQITLQGDDLRLSSATGNEWLTHTTGRKLTRSLAQDRLPPTEPGTPIPASFVLDRLSEVGVVSMGFPWSVENLQRVGTGLRAQIRTGEAGWAPLLDAVLSTASVVLPGPAVLRMPAAIGEMVLGSSRTEALLQVEVVGPDTVQVSIAAMDGVVIGYLDGLRFAEPDSEPAGSLVHRIEWQPVTIEESSQPEAGLLELRARRGESVSAAAARMSVELLDALRSDGSGGVWCVTRGVRAASTHHSLAQAALWGLGRIATSEFPHRFRGVVDLPEYPSELDKTVLRGLARSEQPGEDVFAIENGRILAARLAACEADDQQGPRCRPDKTYLITGGSGALAGPIAHWLADRGARQLVLLSRTGLADSQLVDELRVKGVTVRLVRADVADLDAVRIGLDLRKLALPPIAGVVHAAGVTDNGYLEFLGQKEIRRVLRPKVDGALVLHQLFPVGSVDFFVLFSSAGQLLHLPGQGAYAAANSVLDALARQRRTAGDHGALALAWTSWRGLGMSTSSTSIDAELAAQGTGDLTPDQALRAWGRIGLGAAANLALLRVLPDVAVPPILTNLVTARRTAQPAAWTELPDDQRLRFLTSAVADLAAQMLKTATLDHDAALSKLGLDSLLSASFRRELGTRLGRRLEPTLLWHHPTVNAIATYLFTEGISS